MLQMKFEPNWASGFDLSLKILFENMDRQQTTMNNGISFSSPWAFGSAELKNIKFVQTYMMTISIKS